MKTLELIPHLSEKTISGVNRRYAFKVARIATKPEIRKEIAKVFKVEVVKVNTLNYKPQIVQKGRFTGQTKGYKLVLATLKQGQKIAGFEMAEEKGKSKTEKKNGDKK